MGTNNLEISDWFICHSMKLHLMFVGMLQSSPSPAMPSMTSSRSSPINRLVWMFQTFTYSPELGKIDKLDI
jgi:hypothetical protein